MLDDLELFEEEFTGEEWALEEYAGAFEDE